MSCGPVNGRADQALVRKLNTSLVLDSLRTSAPLSRARISARTGLNRSTVSSVISELLNDNLVRETGLQSSSGGRPGMLLELNPDGGCAIGIELGVDFISLILTNFTAEPLWRQRALHDPEQDIEQTLMVAQSLIRNALDLGTQRGLRPLGIGLGVPGLVSIPDNELVMSPNLAVEHVTFRDAWESKFGVPIFFENEANAAALGEYYFGVGRGVRNFIFISAGVGLGSGIIIDGRLFRGSHGFAGEIGHTVTEYGEEPCGCGRRGCFETVVGPRAIVREVRRAVENENGSQVLDLVEGDLDAIDVEVVVKAALSGDRVALAALEEVGRHLGMGAASLVNIFNPEMVILGGALSLASPVLLPVVVRTIRENALPPITEQVKVVASSHGVDACAMGGVALVLDDILREPTHFV